MPAGEGEHKGYSIKQIHPIEADCSVEVNPVACFALLPVTQVSVAHANRQPNSPMSLPENANLGNAIHWPLQLQPVPRLLSGWWHSSALGSNLSITGAKSLADTK
jgi:hypothetical protein